MNKLKGLDMISVYVLLLFLILSDAQWRDGERRYRHREGWRGGGGGRGDGRGRGDGHGRGRSQNNGDIRLRELIKYYNDEIALDDAIRRSAIVRDVINTLEKHQMRPAPIRGKMTSK